MSKNEFVVIQVWTKYATAAEVNETGFDGRWLDYSRCTAAEARTFLGGYMATECGKDFRAVHFIRSEVVLSARQLTVMAEMVPSQWENRPPTDGDHWSVTVVWNTLNDDSPSTTRTQERFVNAWQGPCWSDMLLDIAREGEETGDTVESLKLH